MGPLRAAAAPRAAPRVRPTKAARVMPVLRCQRQPAVYNSVTPPTFETGSYVVTVFTRALIPRQRCGAASGKPPITWRTLRPWPGSSPRRSPPRQNPRQPPGAFSLVARCPLVSTVVKPPIYYAQKSFVATKPTAVLTGSSVCRAICLIRAMASPPVFRASGAAIGWTGRQPRRPWVSSPVREAPRSAPGRTSNRL